MIGNETELKVLPLLRTPEGRSKRKGSRLGCRGVVPSVVPAKAGNLASLPRVNDRKWNEMEPNGTELKVCRSWPLVMRPPQSKRGHAGLISASAVGVNRAKQGQIRLGYGGALLITPEKPRALEVG